MLNLKFSICNLFFYLFIFFSFLFFSLSLLFLFYDLVYFIEWSILSSCSIDVLMTFLFDWMSLIFMSFVMFISSLVIFYSKEYMNSEKNLNRFILLVVMFVMSMMFLIISPNLISILLGWDGLGLVSYCLVIYFQNVKSYNAGMLTALSNRIGDVALLIAIAWMLNYGSWNFVFYLDFMKIDYEMSIIMLMVILAAMTKSAQIPFSSWLPAAMAAPTPVSALVHSSTLVTAGVYLLIRFNILFMVEVKFFSFLLLIGGLTMFMAGFCANFEFDLKKIIALSTLSQLGLMMSILSMGFPKLAFFHLLTHALFKALLFMCAGVIIHNMKNSQDIRDMGLLIYYMPLTVSCLNLANLALCGMPFLAGFYSKDLILEIVMISDMNLFSFFLYFISTGLTVCYSFRLVYYSLMGDFNLMSLNLLNDSGFIMLKSMMGLMFMAVIGGSMLNWLIFSSFYCICLPFYLKNLILFVCFMGGFLGLLLNFYKFYFSNKSLSMMFLTNFSSFMWFMPLLSTVAIINYPLKYGMNMVKYFDLGWLEYFGSQNLKIIFMKNYSIYLQTLQNNNLKIFMLIFLVWLLLILLFLLF
uniref:NADH-ubiquinone oxidoreductase chain 5 n=1 Tax=Thienemanniella tusimufegea TaxID=3072307 RepID=A0AA51M6H9_9DIPT|nr:NADH dehydrogenase subunit 5 [Thienemanniella tusimufegea]WML69363.1 NADH dehydrogenase subunit 5 [Thienemanniella tusimufegea]